MSELVRTNQRETLFEITFNRPEKRNAINLEMLGQFDAAVAQASRRPGLRAVLISGAGKTFSAGIDVTVFLTMTERYGSNWRQRMRAITADLQAVLNRLERIELPTIALIHGHCLGLALELALACDIRIAAEGTLLGLPETRLGIIPDVGGTTRLTRLVGPGLAKELIFTGRQFDATYAECRGIVNQVVAPAELLQAGERLAAEISLSAPLAVGMAKRVVDNTADIDRGLLLEGWAQSQLIGSADFAEGVQSFLQRRAADFKGE